ncbi:MAG TPA: hypothetical protein DCL06_02800 [Corynebacterium variabile]|uniref:Uncharacterized protein n=2 Tax=Corynebacterium variabile TaxID=1727 RepID=A0A3B9QSR6_9CORY|nr:hypothetical protein [Corynebacterium variabile]
MRRSLHLRRRDRTDYTEWDATWDRWPGAAVEAGLDASDHDAAVGEVTIDDLAPSYATGTAETPVDATAVKEHVTAS